MARRLPRRDNPAHQRLPLIELTVSTHEAGLDAGVRRIFLECTSTHASRYNTGIQRAVRNLVRASLAAPGPWTCIGVVYNGRYLEPLPGFPGHWADDGGPQPTTSGIDWLGRAFHRVRKDLTRIAPALWLREALYSERMEYGLRRVVYAAQNGGRWLRSFRTRGAPRIEFRSDDILVLLDATWSVDLTGELRRAYVAGVTIWVVINDLIPIEHPDLAPEGTPIQLDKWLRRTVPWASGMLGISRAVADALRAHLARAGIVRGALPPPRVDHFYLGAGLDRTNARLGAMEPVTAVFRGLEGNVYLVVGTVEPRKNHARILNIFERLWSEDSKTTVLIMGRLGWRSDDLAQRIRTHPQFGNRLVWFQAASDAELDYAYRHASALIFASSCEGFGLPLVEAMQYGLPVLASDIAVFREIGGDYPEYFEPDQEDSLHEAIRRFELAHPLSASLDRRAQPWLSWSDSAQMLLKKVTDSADDA
jgi:alpha-1,2-rhamnosyltransferase